ncbi:hypothetical protein ASPWEDRAFT_112005 [Aspergillus wentii DTO 134E9]|uniref:Cytochrome b5 heme-binding domain-containing protein n=1 Tax=Aspergillus wentii DTO 134E9 TaxID=1073089 RepID=A0A1L9RIN9_ASPWE|nr:uncharacterized protein ASPWEDRAFT_112005 [Aspergillus wentii DTO 134E9]KAI9932241.1 hypothetical protein MW887_009751 [Aspergillus wentii]OJJ34800.1 hypothetical protein ASPWEDRAFT_112005 [Aspergillus wentii DTO 134E9]
MSELRQRQVAQDSSSKSDTSGVKKTQQGRSRNGENRGISFLDVIRVLVTLVVASCGMSYYMTASESLLWGYRPWFTRWPVLVRYVKGPLALTPDQLSLYNGTDTTLPIYLVVNGTIFDVSANRMVYGPGGHYNFFTGRDATRAFVTGCFQEDLTPSLYGLEEMFIPIDDENSEAEKALSSGQKKIRREQDVRLARTRVRSQVQHWENFFRNHKKYFEVGKVVGNEEQRKEKWELCRAAKQQRPKRKTDN